MAGREYTARTRFKVINNVGSHFRLTQRATVTGRQYYMPGQFDTYYGHADMTLDIKTYPGWKGELRPIIYHRDVDGDRSNGNYITYFLMPWSGYDLSRLLPEELYIQSCKLTYNADYTISDEQYTASIVEQELLSRVDDLLYMQKRVGSAARPYFSKFHYDTSDSGAVTKLYKNNENLTFPQELPSNWNYAVPIHMMDGIRSDNWSGGTYTVTSSVSFEIVE